MSISPRTGKRAPKEMLVDLARLGREYYEASPMPLELTRLHRTRGGLRKDAPQGVSDS